MADKIYCKIGPVPKNHRLGSMQECLDMNQVRLYGIKKIDPKILEAHLKDKKMSKGRLIYVDEDSDDIELFQQFINEKFDLKIIKIENEEKAFERKTNREQRRLQTKRDKENIKKLQKYINNHPEVVKIDLNEKDKEEIVAEQAN